MTDADDVIYWVERCCVIPAGPDKGKPVRLDTQQKHTIHALYDYPGDNIAGPITGPLAAFLALLHVCGPKGAERVPPPPLDIDPFTVWASADARCLKVLKRVGERIVCDALGTSYPKAA